MPKAIIGMALENQMLSGETLRDCCTGFLQVVRDRIQSASPARIACLAIS